VSGWGVALVCVACGGGAADGNPDFGSVTPFGGGGSSSAPGGPGNPTGGSGTTGTGTAPPGVGSGGTGSNEQNQVGGGPIVGAAGGSSAAGSSGSNNTGNTAGTSAGVAGATGAAGSSNTAGAAGSQGNGPPVTTLPEPPGDAFFFDDFEAGAVGTQPAAWARWIDYTTTAGNAADRPQFALLDDQDPYDGNQAVHFHVTAPSQPAQLTIALPTGTNRLYVRAYVKSATQLGARQPDNPSNHETLIALRAGSGKNDFELRFGEAKGALGFNIVGDGRNDAVAPPQAQWGSGPAMSPNEWHCVEVDFLNDNPNSPQAHASVDGVLVRSVTSLADWHVGLSGAGVQWLNGMFGEVVLGWQSFSNPAANDVWMDDVVLSNSPIGCD